MNVQNFEAQMLQLQLFALAGSLIAAIATLFAIYLVIRYAIRDGIRDSGLVERQRHHPAPPRLTNDTMPGPDMRAER
jgi:UDP-N-acetylmuramyl pentapeptide phosphotransferase/UDP-N-acetylglucosamine-1-phosphate transferase